MARKGLSPTQRTLAKLRAGGCLAEVVERWNAYAGPYGIRQDLFGFIDILALVPGQKGCLGIQACSGSGAAVRARKIREDCREAMERWLDAGNRIEIWAWRKIKIKRGGKAVRWTPRVIKVERDSPPDLPVFEDGFDPTVENRARFVGHVVDDAARLAADLVEKAIRQAEKKEEPHGG